jgi:hypothetical protein
MRSSPFLLLLALFASPLIAFSFACGSSSEGAQEAAEAGTDCGVAHNEAGCPATYDTSALPTACAPIGLACSYPGSGDGTGCNAANLSCTAALGDAGADAGQGRWVATQ